MKKLSQDGYYACDLPPKSCLCTQDQREQCRNSRWKSYSTQDREHMQRKGIPTRQAPHSSSETEHRK